MKVKYWTKSLVLPLVIVFVSLFPIIARADSPPNVINLLKGWNFVSFPLEPPHPAIQAVLSDTSDNLRIAWGYDNRSKVWLKYKPSAGNNTLLTIEPGKGYWLYMDASVQHQLKGTTPTTDEIHLYEGWNLVGYNGNDDFDLTAGLAPMRNRWNVIWNWGGGQWKASVRGLNDLWPGILPLTKLNLARAYWIRVTNGVGELDWKQTIPFARVIPGRALKGDVLTVDGSKSELATEMIVSSFSCDFGDGSSVITQANPLFTHVYTSAGRFTVTLTVTDSKGVSASQSGDVEVGEFSFSLPVNISNNGSYSQCQSMSRGSDGSLNLVWQDSGGLSFSRSTDGGATFSPPKTVIPPEAWADFRDMKIASTGEVIHIVLTAYDLSNGWAGVIYTRSDDGGQTFWDPLLVSYGAVANAYAPKLFSDVGDSLLIAWTEGDVDHPSRVMFTRSLDKGTTFSLPAQLPYFVGGSAVVRGETVYTIGRESSLFLAKSTDGGKTFSRSGDIPNSTEIPLDLTLAVDPSGNAYVLWSVWSPMPKKSALFSKSNDGGKTFSVPRVLTDQLEAGFGLAAGSAGDVYITYSTGYCYDNTHQSFLLFSSDGGSTFSAPVKISSVGSRDQNPSVLVLGSNELAFLWNGPFKLPPLPPDNVWLTPDVFYCTGRFLIQ